MEYYPFLYGSTYDNYREEDILKRKKIKIVIHISKRKKFIGKEKIEEIRVPIESDEETFDLLQINLDLYHYLHDTVDFIHQHIMKQNPVLLLGYGHKQEVDILVSAFFMKYGKVPPKLAMYYVKTKKRNVFLPECIYEYCLDKYYEDITRNDS